MRIFSAIAVLALLAATSANAAGLPTHFRDFAKNSAAVLAGEAARPNGEGWKKLCFDARLAEREEKKAQARMPQPVEACRPATPTRWFVTLPRKYS